MVWWLFATATPTTSNTQPTQQPMHPTTATAQQHDNDDFDLIDDEISLKLLSNRTGRDVIVRARLSWGLYLRAVLQEAQPIALAFGTPEAHAVLETFFLERNVSAGAPRPQWEAAKLGLEEDPSLLIEVLEYSAGLSSMLVFREACDIFGKMFRALTNSPLPVPNPSATGTSHAMARPAYGHPSWTLDTTSNIKACGEAIRSKFRLQCEESMRGAKKLDELLRYFSGVVNVGGTTHGMTHSSRPKPTEQPDFNNTLSECDPFRSREWQHDDMAASCPSCNRKFASGYTKFFTGVYASHCRVCGLRKCHDCTLFKVDKSIARLSKPGNGEEPQMRKACVDCYRTARNMQRFAFLGQAFVYAGLDIVQISILRTVNHTWSVSAELILHGLRAAVYEFTTAASVQGLLAPSVNSSSVQQQSLIEHEAPHFTRIHPVPVPELHGVPSSAAFNASTSSASHDGAFPRSANASLSPGRSAATPAGVGSRGKALNSAVNKSIRRLYQSSAKLFVGHPEHIIMMFTLLDWSNPDDVQLAVAVLRKTTNAISASSTHSNSKHRSSSADNDEGNVLHSWSHWHLMCSRSCCAMPHGMFGVRMLDALQLAHECKQRQEAEDMVVTTLLLGPSHDAAVAATLVPLLLDLHPSKATHAVLGHLACKNPSLGLQMICDFRSRVPPSSDALDEAKQFTSFVTEAVRRASHQRPPSNSTGEASATAASQHLQQVNKFELAQKFIDALQECMASFQQSYAVDLAKVKQGLYKALDRKGLVKEIGGATTTTIIPASDMPPPALTSRHGRSTSLSSTSSSAVSADAPAVATAPLQPVTFTTPDFITTFDFMFPFDKSVTIVGVQLRGVRLMPSKVRPVMIPLVDAKNRVHHVLWKGEDMRQDYIVCLCGIRLQQVLRDSPTVNPPPDPRLVPSYRVLPLSQESGLIECVAQSTSVQAITAKHHEAHKAAPLPPSQHRPRRASIAPDEDEDDTNRTNSLSSNGRAPVPAPLNSQAIAGSPMLWYLHDVSLAFHENQIKTVGKYFLTSAKFFILFNYLLNLRDRHRDNVMMTEPGCIFHIDFGMTRNQKAMGEGLTPSYVRFDKDVEHCIAFFNGAPRVGKTQEQAVEEFVNEVATWYLAIRPHAHDLYLLLRHVIAAKHHGSVTSRQPAHHHQSSAAFCHVGPFAPPAAQEMMSAVFVEEDVDLQHNLEDLFQRHLGEDSARREFVRRVMDSRGKEMVKDMTYGANKIVKSWLEDFGARMMTMMNQ